MTYYMLNKPRGLVCARTDRESPTVMELFPGESRNTLFPLGRLDKNTEGLLLVTDDGKLNRRLLDPECRVEKQYFLWAAGEPTEAVCRAIREGVRCKGLPDPTRPARFEVLERGHLGDIAELVFPIRREMAQKQPELPAFSAHLWLTEGKRHQVKRMLEAVGCTVVYLRRVAFGPLRLDEALAPGQYRPLTEEEIALLRAAAIPCHGSTQ